MSRRGTPLKPNINRDDDEQKRLARAIRFSTGCSTNASSLSEAFNGLSLGNNKNQHQKSFFARTRKMDPQGNQTFDRARTERELKSLFGTHCPNATDKYQILRKRDDLLSILAKLDFGSKLATDVAKRLGTCEDKCPERERYMRQITNQLHPFECNSDGTLNHILVVTNYSRPAADQDEPLSHELRSPAALKKTMDYLILMCNESMPKSDLVLWYDFLWSRTRAIRKELTQQMMVDKLAVELVEKCTRFHIYAAFRMADLETRDFDQKLNTENLSKCLQSLKHLYHDLAQKSIYCECEAEFRSYDILLNLDNSNALTLSHTYREEVKNSPVFRLATQLACAFQTDNYVSFFRLIREKATFLQTCLCRNYFSAIRAKAIHTIVKIYRPIKFPIQKLTELLAFNDDYDTLAFLNEMCLKADLDGKFELMPGYQAFTNLANGSKYGNQVVQNKLKKPLPQILANGPIRAPVFQSPYSSFKSDYYKVQY